MLGGGLVQAGEPAHRRRPRATLRRAGRRRRAPPAGRDRAGRLRRAGRRGRCGAGGAPGRAVVIRAGRRLPTFRDTPDAAFEAADEAVAAGVDGLFCYDHIWPIGQPERPALAPFPILGALAARFQPDGATGGPFLGTLVARVGLVPNERPGGAVRRARPAGARPRDRRARHGRPPERGGEPRLRDRLRAGGRAPRRMVGAGPRAGRRRG